MTTIVYHDGIIAVDSRRTMGSLIVSDCVNKVNITNGVAFILFGATCDTHAIVNAYFDNDYRKIKGKGGFIVDSSRVYLCGIYADDGFWKDDITGQSYALGSGQEFALTALDMGCTAVQAVKMAIKRDIYTGGKVRTFKVK